MLDFCAEHGIVSDIEMIPIQEINEAYERMLKSDVKYRFVIDMASLKKGAPCSTLFPAPGDGSHFGDLPTKKGDLAVALLKWIKMESGFHIIDMEDLIAADGFEIKQQQQEDQSHCRRNERIGLQRQT